MNSVFNNCSLPTHQYGYVRTEFCNNLNPDTIGVMPCVIFGAESIPDHALGFHILREDGAMISQIPIHALCWTESARLLKLSDLCPWDCFGFNLSGHCYDYLKDRRMYVKLGGGTIEPARYVCTFDFLANGYSDYPEQHKHLHFARLADGNFCLQPNNHVQFIDDSFTTSLFSWENPPRIETNKLEWFCENGDLVNGGRNTSHRIHEPIQSTIFPRLHVSSVERRRGDENSLAD